MPTSRVLAAVNSLLLALGLLGAARPSLRAEESGVDSLSPAELRIEGARKVLQKQPNRVQAYNDLAMALIRRARETGDTSYYQQAEEAVANSLRVQPDNFEAGQARVALRLAEQRYREALEEARALNHRSPDGVLVWGYMAEAQAALGDYDAAEQSAQWMMNLRPGNMPAYLCGAALREDWGDLEGALDFLSRALQQVPPLETEEFARILTQMARLNRLAGRPEAAEPLLQQALKTFPEYYLSLEELAEVRLVEQRYPEAVELLERRNRKFASLHSRYQEARALGAPGNGPRREAPMPTSSAGRAAGLSNPTTPTWNSWPITPGAPSSRVKRCASRAGRWNAATTLGRWMPMPGRCTHTARRKRPTARWRKRSPWAAAVLRSSTTRE